LPDWVTKPILLRGGVPHEATATSSKQTFKPANFKELVLYHRAFEAVLWSLPAADMLMMRYAQKEWDMNEGRCFLF
jgi:hypothetical protein